MAFRCTVGPNPPMPWTRSGPIIAQTWLPSLSNLTVVAGYVRFRKVAAAPSSALNPQDGSDACTLRPAHLETKQMALTFVGMLAHDMQQNHLSGGLIRHVARVLNGYFCVTVHVDRCQDLPYGFHHYLRRSVPNCIM
jgi:hypothetical protein